MDPSSDRSRPVPRERVTPLAAALAAGIALGEQASGVPWMPGTWPWIVAGGLALIAASIARARACRWTLAPIAAAVMCLGASWIDVRLHTVARGDLAARAHAGAPVLVRVRGEAMEPPRLHDRDAGSMARFGHRPPATYFTLRVTALIGRGGDGTPARGTLLVRVDETLAPFRAGDTVEALGMLHAPAPPGNPGEFDYRAYARGHGRAGLLSVPRRDLVSVSPGARSGPPAWLRWRHALRRSAAAWLLSDLPAEGSARRNALLSALLLGRRDPQADGVGESFRRAGLAHFMAISGLHLGVLAGFVLLAARLCGGHRRWHGWLVIGVVAVYLVLVEVRMPVLRAGLMTMAACLGLAAGRRPAVGGLVAASALGLLLWRPQELFTAGFQLSYGVVLGLIHLAPLVRARLFGLPDAFAASSAEMLGQWLRTTCATALTAWAVATPISLYHWGVLWPMAAPFSVVVLPLVAVVLATGYMKIVLAPLLPSVSLLLAVPLALGADVLLAVVSAMDAVPGSIVHAGFPPAAWSLAAIGWFAAWAVLGSRIWGFWGGRRGRATIGAAGAALLLWGLWPALPFDRAAALRIDMLAVGDGSCIVLRSGGATALFDAGSSDLDAGRRRVVPALRRLGVRSIDLLVISHPNLDHYSAVLEIVDELRVRMVLVTPQLLRAADGEPGGPVAYLLDELSRRLVPVRAVAAGEQRRVGDTRWRWFHPPRDRDFDAVNDGSMVVRVSAAGRGVLLCGDIQQEAMDLLGDLRGTQRIDVLEMPHHGSLHDRAEAFVAGLDPRVVLHSTGPGRWARTAASWRTLLGGSRHLVTARDGACVVEVDDDGSISVERFIELPSPDD